jgi:choline dehydrogenase
MLARARRRRARRGDGRTRLHGVDRIVVADCSLMPVVSRAKTNIPAAVVGERIAGDVLASL